MLLEHERQQELAKIQQGPAPGTRGPELGPRPNLLPPIPPLRGQPPNSLRTGEMCETMIHCDALFNYVLFMRSKSCI